MDRSASPFFQILTENLKDYPQQAAINALVTDREGDHYDFNVSNNGGQSSSIYKFAGHKDIWPGVDFIQTIQLSSTTLQRILLESGQTLKDYDALILDVQGAELLVLKGAGLSLNHLRFIKTEAADFDAYAGGCQIGELNEFLTNRGFRCVRKERWMKETIGSYFDVLYERL